MGVKKYMNKLIESARGKVQEGVRKVSPFRKITDALNQGNQGRPSPTKEPPRSRPVPPNKRKRKKIKPKGAFR
jgi:hypothetical protein